MSTFFLLILSILGVNLIVLVSTAVYMIENSVRCKRCLKQGDRKVTKKKSRVEKKEKLKAVDKSNSKSTSKDVTRETTNGTRKIESDEDSEKEDTMLKEILEEIESDLRKYKNMTECLMRLENLNSKYPQNEEILWKIGLAHQKMVQNSHDIDFNKKHIDKGIEACEASLKINYNQAQVHKCLAILIGSKGKNANIKEKIKSSKSFKKHLDTALALDPEDLTLLYMAGRFCYEVSSLTWIETKVLKRMFTEPLNCSFESALKCFLKCDALATEKWQENRLYIAKCYIKLENYEDAIRWLKKAENTKDIYSGEDIHKEVKDLLKIYSSYG